MRSILLILLSVLLFGCTEKQQRNDRDTSEQQYAAILINENIEEVTDVLHSQMPEVFQHFTPLTDDERFAYFFETRGGTFPTSLTVYAVHDDDIENAVHLFAINGREGDFSTHCITLSEDLKTLFFVTTQNQNLRGRRHPPTNAPNLYMANGVTGELQRLPVFIPEHVWYSFRITRDGRFVVFIDPFPDHDYESGRFTGGAERHQATIVVYDVEQRTTMRYVWEIEGWIESSWDLTATDNVFGIFGTSERGRRLARAEFDPESMELKTIYDFTGGGVSKIPPPEYDEDWREDELFIQMENPAINLQVRPLESNFETLVNNGQVTIRRYKGTTKDVVIPSSIGGMPVVAIGDQAFYRMQLTSLIIPNSVTHIGDRAFDGNQLTTITIPNSVTHIEDRAFAKNRLTTITIPNNLTHIGHAVFAENELTNLTIPDSVTHIAEDMFSSNQLTTITIPNNVTHIGDGAFSKNQLTNLTIPNSVTYIGEYAFSSNQLTDLTIPTSVTHIGDHAFSANDLTNLTIPNSVTHIGRFAFYDNQLTSLTIPNSVTHIRTSAFSSNQLTNLTIPNSVTDIWEAAFSHNQLTDLTIPNSVTYISDNAFFANHLTNLIIPNSVTHIGHTAFSQNRLSNLTLPNRITRIEYDTFSHNQLTNLTIPNSVAFIGAEAFARNQLTNLMLPNSVTRIEAGAFAHNQLTDLTIPNSVTNIGRFAFYKNRLSNLTIPNSVTHIASDAFDEQVKITRSP